MNDFKIDETPKKAVTPIGSFYTHPFSVDPNNVYYATEEELSKLGKHELKWSSEEYQADEPVYEEVHETDENGMPLPPKKVQVGTKRVTKTRPILIPNDPTSENEKRAKLKRIGELKSELAKTDYEAIKFAEGEMTAEEYAPYKIKRASYRAEINRLQEELGEAE